jgi:3-oxoacyl-[acyl-carrier-protein] synthase-3
MSQKHDIYIRALEYYLPAHMMSNDELQKSRPDWNVPQIASKTGVLNRHIARQDECASDLAYEAVLKLIKNSGIHKDEIDGIVYCTQSPDHIMPPNSTLLHAKLDISKRAFAFDFNLACSGFVYGLAIAKSMMESLRLQNVLVVTADTYSKYIYPRDRSASSLFGDGAAATLLSSAANPVSKIIDFLLETDGHGGKNFMIKAGGLRFPKTPDTATVKSDLTNNQWTDEHIRMDGKAVLDFAMREIPDAVNRILLRNNLKLNDLDLILFHQASQMALDKLCKEMQVPPEKTFTNIADVGNTVSSSLAIALKDAEKKVPISRGNLVLLVGFGVGFSWGCCLLRW